MKEIPWRFVRALHLKKRREETGLSLVEGPKVVRVCLEAGVELRSVFLAESFARSEGGNSLRKLLDEYLRETSGLLDRPVRAYVTRDELFAKISTTDTPQGVLAVLPVPSRFFRGEPSGKWSEPLVVAGSGIQDPGNVGTMIRTAAAFGATEIIFGDDSADPFSPKALRASSGAFAQVRVLRAKRLEDELSRWKERGVPLWKTDPGAGKLPWETPLSGPAALIFGSEARGLPPSLEKLTDLAIKVPMPGGVESLNVGVSCAIILYEVLRQRLTQGG